MAETGVQPQVYLIPKSVLVWWLQAASVSLKALDRPEPSPLWGSCSPAVVSTSCHYSLHLEQDLGWYLATEPGHDNWMEGYPIGSLHAGCGCNNPIRLSPVWEFPWDVRREKQRPCLVAQSLKQSCSDDEAHSSFSWGLLCMWSDPQGWYPEWWIRGWFLKLGSISVCPHHYPLT